MDRPVIQALSPFILPQRAKKIVRWNARIAKLEARFPKKTNQYGMGFAWRVYAIRNKERNIIQIVAYYRLEYAFPLLDILPNGEGFIIRRSIDHKRKNGSYLTKDEAVEAGKSYLRQNKKFTACLCKQYLEENNDFL